MVSKPSHPSREAPPVSCPYHLSGAAPSERGGYRKPTLFTWFRAPPTDMGEEEENITYPSHVLLLPLRRVRRRG
eukprot:8096979-Pyramimonas_sp.AAC.1